MSDDDPTPEDPETEPTEPDDAPAQEPSKAEGPKPAGTDWKALARKHEERAKENKKAADAATATQAATANQLEQISVLLGLKKGEEIDPEKLKEQLTGERDKAAAEATEARRELAVFKAADKAKANTSELLDSLSFRKAVAELDPADKGFEGEVLALAKQAVKDNPTKFGRADAKPDKRSTTADAMNGGKGTGPRPTSLHAALEARHET